MNIFVRTLLIAHQYGANFFYVANSTSYITMAGKNKSDKDIEKQNEKLEEIISRLKSVESQIVDLKSENKSLASQVNGLKKDNDSLKKNT